MLISFRFWALGLLLLPMFSAPLQAAGYSMPGWATSQVSSAMCQGSRMHLVATGSVAVAYERAYRSLLVPDLMLRVEAAYQRGLTPGTPTNLAITAVPPDANRYYVDWLGDRADVREVWRATDTNTFFEGGYIGTGERFFGAFEAVVNIRVQRLPDGNTGFRADALVYPHNGIIRFVFQNLLSVESYFHDTMVEMSAEIARLCIEICRMDNPATAALR